MMKLSIKQTKAIDILEDNKTNDLLFGGAAGGGKTALGCYYILKQGFKYKNTRFLIGRSKLNILKQTTLITLFKVCGYLHLKSNIHYKYNDQSHIISLNNGSCILLKDLFYYPSDPEFDSLGSLEITGAFIDECNQITEKAWNIVKSRIRHGLDENNLIPKILGTCNPAKNFIYQRFYKPFKENKLPENYQFIQSLVTDNPYISKHYIDNLNQLDEKSKQRLLNGNWEFDDDPSILMNYEKIVDLFTNEFAKTGIKYISADIARKGMDKTIIRVWDGLKSIKKVILIKSLLTDTVNVIKRLQREYNVPNSNTIVDEDGVGGGVVDMLKCKGFINNSTPVKEENEKKNYSNLRSQCYFKLSNYVNNNQIYLNDTNIDERNNVVQELEQIRQKNIDKDGKLQIISREEIKQNIGRSPDESSCIMMRMYFELKPFRIAVYSE